MKVKSIVSVTLRKNTSENITYDVSAEIKRGNTIYRSLANLSFIWEPTNETKKQLEDLRNVPITREETNQFLRRIGEKLYEVLFVQNPPLLQALEEEQRTYPNDSVRLRLIIASESLSILPWEALFNERYLAVRGDLPIVRALPKNTEKKPQEHPLIGRNLHVLFLSASPKVPGYASLNIEETYNQLQASIQQDSQQERGILTRRMKITPILNVTRKKLIRELTENPNKYHIICFAGHGTPEHLLFDDGIGEENGKSERGECDEVNAEEFAAILRPEQNAIRLVYLMACETAGASQMYSSEPLAGFARTLTDKAELSAVIAMQTKVQYAAIQKFTVDFFHRITYYKPIDIALSEARQQLLVNSQAPRDFIAPVLYLQTDESRLFRSAIPWLIVTLSGAILIALCVIGAQFVLSALDTEYQNRHEAALAEVALNQRIQLIGHSSLSLGERVPPADTPTILNDRIWIRDTKGLVDSFALTGSERITYEKVGGSPTAPMSAYGYVWISSADDKKVTRIAPDGSMKQISVVPRPLAPLSAGGYLWVLSDSTHTMTKIEPNSGDTSEIRIGPGVQPAFSDEDYIWILKDSEPKFLRFGADETTEFDAPSRLISGYSSDGWLWLTTDDGKLLQVDRHTGHIANTVLLNMTASLVNSFEGRLWLLERNGTRVVSVELTNLQNPVIWQMDAVARRLFFTPGRVWITTESQKLKKDTAAFNALAQTGLTLPTNTPKLHIFDIKTGHPLKNFDIADAESLTRLAFDGRQGWFILPSQDTVLVVSLDTGTEVRRLSVCDGASGPVFDGLNMWFGCGGSRLIAGLPADVIFTGVSGNEDSVQVLDYTPLLIDNSLWVQQPTTGRLLIYDGETRVDEVILDGTIKSIIPDAPYVWVATATGSIHRLQPAYVQRDWVDERYNLKHYQIQMMQKPVEGEINSMHLVGDYVWVLHTDIEHLSDTPGITIFRREPFVKSDSYNLGVPTGLKAIGSDVWIGVSGVKQGRILRFDAATTRLKKEYDLPDTSNASWAPIQVGDQLWFVAGAPVLNEIGEFIWDIFTQKPDEHVPTIYVFDPLTETFSKRYDTLNAPTAGTLQKPYVWFSSNPLTVVNEQTTTNTGLLYAVDTRDGSFIGTWNLCSTITAPYPLANRMWVGCNKGGSDMWSFTGDPPQERHYDQPIGTSPWQPIEHDGKIWFTFQTSNTAAVFDAKSGDLLERYAVVSDPGPPFLYHGEIWVYGIRDGVIQRLSGG